MTDDHTTSGIHDCRIALVIDQAIKLARVRRERSPSSLLWHFARRVRRPTKRLSKWCVIRNPTVVDCDLQCIGLRPRNRERST
jgi:hypothetical protein